MANKHRIHIKPTKKTFDFKASMQRIAEVYQETERHLTPLIIKDNMPPSAAMVLIAMYADGLISGNTKGHRMTEKQVYDACHTFIYFWKSGLFKPSPEYPYTLEQTLAEGYDE